MKNETIKTLLRREKELISEIEDIKAEFLFFPFLNGVITGQRYVMPLYRAELVSFTEYLSAAIQKLN